MKPDEPLRPEELHSEILTPRELAALANSLETPQDAVMEQLMEALERSADAQQEAVWPPLLEEPRRRVDTRYPSPATSHRPVVGPVLVAAKRSFRFVFQPFINEVLRRQVEFNEAILASVASVYEQVRVQARTQALWRKEVEERLAALDAKAAKKSKR